MFDRFPEWDEELLLEEMLQDSTMAGTLPKPFPSDRPYRGSQPDSIPTRITHFVQPGRDYDYAEILLALGDRNRHAVSAALRYLIARGVIQATCRGSGNRPLYRRAGAQQ